MGCQNETYIKAELLLDGEILATKDDYSIKQNAINLLADNSSNELVQFISDMLHYGKAAQTYKGYNTQNLQQAALKEFWHQLHFRPQVI